nr:uncharacterized protein zgc:113229 [Gasterosteus aculeatus aculeatus]XP_040029629.1 uncharacterized protein zgc:113229 [Gasterosteus aculeatus aculeatus]
MSQPHDPKDSQSLLQSMLQRLKLQPGKEAQEYRHPPALSTAERGGSIIRKVNGRPVNDFELGANGIPPRVFGISAAERTREIQPPGRCCEVDKGLISSPSQKDDIEADTGEGRLLGHATQPGIIPTGTRQLFPAESLKDAVITSVERTDGAGGSSGSTAVTMGQGLGDPTKNKDMQNVATNSSSRRTQPSSETKRKRWPQKIRERWRDRPGSLSNRGGKKGITLDLKNEQGPELFTAVRVAETANKVEERPLPSLDSSDPGSLPPTRTDNASEGCMGSATNFQFGLGSFSLLEEIVTGQKWARFLNPNQSAASANPRPPGLKIPSSLNESGQTPVIFNKQGGAYNQWDFRGSAASPDSGFMPPDAFQPVSMDVSVAKPDAVRHVHSDAGQAEPMEHGHTRGPPSCAEPKNFLENSVLKKRVQRCRKRPYHGDEMLPMEGINNGQEAEREGMIPSPRLTDIHVMEETGEEQRVDHVPSYTLSSACAPLAPAPRGVLKHSISRDSSVEIVMKRRRVEETRRVHFAEEVVAIEPPALDSYATDSDSDPEDEEDSVAPQECEEQKAAIEEVSAPPRRAALPAWIQALKRRNTRRKHR